MSIAQGVSSRIAIAVEPSWGTDGSGYQEVNVGGAKSGASATGLANTGTAYTADIVVDGVTKSVSVVGSAAQTYTTLLAEINVDLASTAVAALSGGNIRVTSATTGARSTVAITDTGGNHLFSTLTSYSAISTAVPGPQMTVLPVTSFNVNLTKAVYEDNSITADRMERSSIHGNKQVGGDIAFNFGDNNYDSLLESVCNSAWSTNVLKNNEIATRKSFVVEHGQTDIGQYQVFTGVVVNSLTLTIPVDGIVTGTANVLGKSSAVSTTAYDASYTAASVVTPFNHATGTFAEGGSTVGYVTNLTLTIDNGMNANFSLGSAFARDLSSGFAKVSGTATVYFEDQVMLNKFLNATESSLSVTLIDPDANQIVISVPRVKYGSATKQVSGQGPVTLVMNFTGLYSSGDGTNIKFTRS